MAIIVKVVKQNAVGDNEAPPIHDSMITSEDMARHRGERYLNDPDQGAYYAVERRTFRVPHKSAAILPNAWVEITDYHLGLSSQLMKVIKYTIEMTPNSVWGRLEADQYTEVL